MSLHILRRQSWLRTALAVLLLCFAAGTVAHAGHRHEQVGSSAHVVCDYCTSFGSLADAPSHRIAAPNTPTLATGVIVPTLGFIATRPVGVAQARAPPVSC